MASELNVGTIKATPTATGGAVIDASGQTGTTARLELKADRPSADQDSCDIRFYNNNAAPIAHITAVKASANDTDGKLDFYTSNAKRLTIDSAGDVGIGASPTDIDSYSTALEVKGGAAANGGAIYVGNTANENSVRLSSWGGIGSLYTRGAFNLQLGTSNTARVTIDSAGDATFEGGIKIKGSAPSTGGLNIDQSRANGGVQHLSGKTTCADGVWTEVAFVSHSHLFDVKAWVDAGGNKFGGAMFDLGTNYGGSAITRTFHSTSAEVTGVDAGYLNSGGSTSYLLRLKVDLDTLSTCTAYWTISGYAEASVYAI